MGAPAVDLRWLGPSDSLAAFATLLSGFRQEAIADERPTSSEEVGAGIALAPSHRHSYPVVATVDEEPVGAAFVIVDDLRAQSAWLNFLFVVPAHRRRGIGTALLHAVRHQARAAGRGRLRTWSVVGDSAAIAFAERANAAPSLVIEQHRCPVAGLDPDLLRGWVGRASERAGDYSLVTFDGVCPDEHLDAFAAVIPVMNFAPQAEGSEDVVPSPAEVRESMEAHVRQGNEGWTVCARDDSSSRFVGYTELSFSAHRPWSAHQGDTGVDPAHRQRGLGRWMKAQNALRLLEERSHVEFIETRNASANAPMLSINRAMGFGVVARFQEWDVPA